MKRANRRVQRERAGGVGRAWQKEEGRAGGAPANEVALEPFASVTQAPVDRCLVKVCEGCLAAGQVRGRGGVLQRHQPAQHVAHHHHAGTFELLRLHGSRELVQAGHGMALLG